MTTSRRADTPKSRADLRAASGVLLVTRAPPPPGPPIAGQPATVPANPADGDEILIAVWCDGSVTALHGHVDLGTGLRTALAQIVAEELEVELGAVNMVLGSTALAPNQGATIASASIQMHAAPLRQAAAQARAWLVAQAGALPVDHHVLLRGRHVELALSFDAPLKSPADYRLVGTDAPRVDLTAKATGAETFVHDKRLSGMLHGRVVRPPYAGVDAGEFVGNTLESVDESSIAHIPGIRAVVVIRDFIGIVAEREEQAEAAMRELKVTWKLWPGLPPLGDLHSALRNNPATRRVLLERGDVDSAIANAAIPMQCDYIWPYQLHASIGPSYGPARRTRTCCAPIWRCSPACPTRASTWSAWKPPVVMAATAPTTWRRTRRCCRVPCAPRCGCSSRASRSTCGNPRARRSGCR
jgi:nicotinate dehydrogenase subunit B